MLTPAVDVLLAPLRLLPPVVGLLAISAVATTAMLLVAKVTSHPSRINAARRQIYAALLEMRLFNDDLAAVLRAARELVWRNVEYLRALALPIIVASLPLVVLVAHLDAFFARTGLIPGKSALVIARLRDSVQTDPARADVMNATLEVPPAIHLDTPALWFPATNELVWQVTPQTSGQFHPVVRLGEEAISKTMQVSDAVSRRAPSRIERRVLNELFDPADQSLPSSGVIESITIPYPERGMTVFGWRVHWLVLFAVSSLIFALVLKRPLGVTF